MRWLAIDVGSSQKNLSRGREESKGPEVQMSLKAGKDVGHKMPWKQKQRGEVKKVVLVGCRAQMPQEDGGHVKNLWSHCESNRLAFKSKSTGVARAFTFLSLKNYFDSWTTKNHCFFREWSAYHKRILEINSKILAHQVDSRWRVMPGPLLMQVGSSIRQRGQELAEFGRKPSLMIHTMCTRRAE